MRDRYGITEPVEGYIHPCVGPPSVCSAFPVAGSSGWRWTPKAVFTSPPDHPVSGGLSSSLDRLRGGSDAPGGARRDASGAQLVLSHLRHRRSCRGDGPGDGRGIGRVHLSGHFESCSCRNDDDRRLGHAARTYITVSATPGRAETRSNLAMSTWLGHAYQLSNKVHGRTCGQDVSLVRS
jgi:hypothetical protein